MSGTFADDLWDKFDLIIKQVRNGKNFTGTAGKYLLKRAQIEREYAKSIHKLAQDKSFAADTELGTVRDCWNSTRDELADFSNKHETLANELTKIAELIQTYLNDKKKYRKTLVANGDKLTKELKAAEQKESKAKQNYEAAKKKQEESEDEANKVSGTAKEAKAKKSAEAATKKAETADTEYREAVKQLQASQQKFYHDEMPKILEELQKLEENRLDNMKDWLLGVVTAQETIAPALSSATQNMRKVTEAIDRQADVAGFITTTTTHSVKPPEAKYEPYVSSNDSALMRQGSRMSMSPVTIKKTEAAPTTTVPNGNPGAAPAAVAAAAPAVATTAAASTAAGASAMRQQVRALYNYDATEESELSFKANDRLVVLQKDDSGWWQGELNGRVGMFPSNFVEVVDPNAATNSSEQKELGGQCKVLYDYNADSDSELTIKEGEVLTVESEDEGWFFGFNSKGESGRFPSNYVQQL
jgi:uncharacterized membrane-anchored protein YhcB (DUF1043 family)